MNNAISRSISAVVQYRKLLIRAVLSVAYYALLFYLLRLLFFYQVQPEQKDIVMIIVGALVSCFTQVTGYWFKHDDDDDKVAQEPGSEQA